MSFFDRPILNSPYAPPSRHWELDLQGQPTDRIIEAHRSSDLWTALPGTSARSSRGQTSMLFPDEGLSTDATAFNPSPMVNLLRQELETWRALPNPAQWKVTPVTQRLLQHWRAIQQDQNQTVRPFFCQLEAAEAAIWLAEVAPQMGRRGRRFIEWLATANNFALQAEGETPSAATPDLMRIAFKLATGAGKTAVMAMLIAWQALNAVRSSNSRRYSQGFLVVTPGITIRDRLRVLMPNDAQNYYEALNLVVKGALELFRNYDDHDQRLDRPRTILIDSAALESGGEIDKTFRDAHATEIEAFRRERARRGGAGEEISDAEILREVMNTVGREGRLGGQVRCVVSVSMLTEGWDANNVTHIMGLRAFGSRLICEQVIGRALRRLSYAVDPTPDPETGQLLFRTEYADIMGIDGLNFADQARPAPPQPPREVVHVHAVSPERDHLEITFPRVQGYRTDFPKERIDVDLSRMEPYVLTPDKVGATRVQMSGIIGERHTLGLDHLDDARPSSIAYDIASYWVSEKLRDPNGAPKLHLFPHAKRIVLQFLSSDRLVCKGDTRPAQLRYLQLADEVCDLLMGVLIEQPTGRPIIRAVLDPFSPQGSTADVSYNTSSAGRHWPRPDRSHVNWIVPDQDWEIKLAQLLDEHPRVAAYAKNHNLHFEVPYTRDGEAHNYRPDFLVRLKTPEEEPPVTLVVEVKGFRGHDAMLKAEAMRNKWIPAVNRLGAHGRWGFAELRSLHDFRPELDAAIDELLKEPALV